VSRQHARLAVDDSGAVWLSSMGKEPVCVNGQPAHDAVELYTGDQIEVSHHQLFAAESHILMRSNFLSEAMCFPEAGAHYAYKLPNGLTTSCGLL